jgi:hypothetical protein
MTRRRACYVDVLCGITGKRLSIEIRFSLYGLIHGPYDFAGIWGQHYQGVTALLHL